MNDARRNRLPDAGRLDVMCCCRPDNILGTAPADAPGVELREYETSEGLAGVAISAHGTDAERIVGFVPAQARGKGGRKRPTRTWRETKKPRPKR